MEIGILSDEISLDLEEALEEGARLGFTHYELRCLDDYEHRVPRFKDGRLEAVEAAVKSGRMNITGVSPGLFKGDLHDEETVEHQLETLLPETCQITRDLDSDLIIVFAFEDTGIADRARAMQKLARAADICAGYDIRLAIENEPGMYCDTGVKTAVFVEELNKDNSGINWDPGNACSAGEAAYPIGYEAVRSRLLNVHIKDTIPIPPDKWENRLIGDGGVNWVGQFHALKRDAILSHLTLETHVFPLIESTREDIRRIRLMMDWVDTFFPSSNSDETGS